MQFGLVSTATLELCKPQQTQLAASAFLEDRYWTELYETRKTHVPALKQATTPK